MGTRNCANLVLLTVLFTACVSSHHIPMGQEKRSEIFNMYTRFPKAFDAGYVSGSLVESSSGSVPAESDYFTEDHYFDSILEDMEFSIDSGTITLEYLDFPDQKISVYYITPFTSEPYTGTVFFFHGYFDYAAKFDAFINELLKRGYCVAAAELPGHGLSTGTRGEVRSFEDYRIFVEKVVAWAGAKTPSFPSPYFAAGHSTGSAALAMYICSGEDPVFSAAFLSSPLGRTRSFKASVAGAVLLKPFVYGFKAAWEGDYSVNYVPVSWVIAHRDWVNTHPRIPPKFFPVCIAWGEDDDTLDLGYSMEFYNRIFPDNISVMFPEGRHNLYIDSDNMDSVFSTAIDFFSLHTDH